MKLIMFLRNDFQPVVHQFKLLTKHLICISTRVILLNRLNRVSRHICSICYTVQCGICWNIKSHIRELFVLRLEYKTSSGSLMAKWFLFCLGLKDGNKKIISLQRNLIIFLFLYTDFSFVTIIFQEPAKKRKFNSMETVF